MYPDEWQVEGHICLLHFFVAVSTYGIVSGIPLDNRRNFLQTNIQTVVFSLTILFK